MSSEFRFISIVGTILGSTPAAMEDRIAKLLAAFHPENAVAASPSTRGVTAYDFYTPTGEAPSGYTSPVHELFYGRSTGLPQVYARVASGLSTVFAAQIICPDTRRYMYTAESKACNSGNSYSIAVPNWSTSQGADVAPTITLALTGAGSSACKLRYVDTALATTTDLILDLSGIGSGSHTVVVDMANMLITLDGSHAANLRTSDVLTFWRIGPGGGTFSVPSGTTNLTSATAAYRQARA